MYIFVNKKEKILHINMIFLNKNILNHKLLFDFFHLTLILFAGVIVCLSTLTFVPLLGTPVQLLI